MENTIDKSIQRKVMALLKWDELRYAQNIESCGIEYLKKYVPDYPQVVSQIQKSKIFWNWWKAHWEKRELQFLESIDYEPHPLLDPVEIYTEHHDPRTLAAAIYLNGQVLSDSYAQLIGDITKEQLQEVEA